MYSDTKPTVNEIQNVLHFAKKYCTRVCDVLDVHDGDTITVMLDLGFKTYQERRLRFANVYAPELNTELGQTCKVFVEKWIDDYSPGKVIVVSHKDAETEKYGRYLGTIYSFDESRCLNDDLNKFLTEAKAAYLERVTSPC